MPRCSKRITCNRYWTPAYLGFCAVVTELLFGSMWTSLHLFWCTNIIEVLLQLLCFMMLLVLSLKIIYYILDSTRLPCTILTWILLLYLGSLSPLLQQSCLSRQDIFGQLKSTALGIYSLFMCLECQLDLNCGSFSAVVITSCLDFLDPSY